MVAAGILLQIGRVRLGGFVRVVATLPAAAARMRGVAAQNERGSRGVALHPGP